jgi:hypothetical protein
LIPVKVVIEMGCQEIERSRVLDEKDEAQQLAGCGGIKKNRRSELLLRPKLYQKKMGEKREDDEEEVVEMSDDIIGTWKLRFLSSRICKSKCRRKQRYMNTSN